MDTSIAGEEDPGAAMDTSGVIPSPHPPTSTHRPSAPRQRIHRVLLDRIAGFFITTFVGPSFGASTEDLDRESLHALQALRKAHPIVDALSKQAKAILVFPKIIPTGLVLGGGYGEGVLMNGDRSNDYYNSVSSAWDWQTGTASYTYIVFLVSDNAVHHINQSRHWELGIGPSMVMVNRSVGTAHSISLLKEDTYALITNPSGQMVDLDIAGTRVNRIKSSA